MQKTTHSRFCKKKSGKLKKSRRGHFFQTNSIFNNNKTALSPTKKTLFQSQAQETENVDSSCWNKPRGGTQKDRQASWNTKFRAKPLLPLHKGHPLCRLLPFLRTELQSRTLPDPQNDRRSCSPLSVSHPLLEKHVFCFVFLKKVVLKRS